MGGNAFYGSSYTTLSIPASLTEISADSFANFKGKFESITVAEGNSVLYVNDDVDSANYGQLCRRTRRARRRSCCRPTLDRVLDGILYSKDGTTLISVTKAFAGGEYTVKEGCTEIADGAFEGCTTLTSISGADVKTVGSSAFSGCTALANVDLPAVESLGGGVGVLWLLVAEKRELPQRGGRSGLDVQRLLVA